MEITKKVCSPDKGCGQEKNISEYNWNGNTFRHICKECQKQYKRRYSEKNQEKIRDGLKKWRTKNIKKIMLDRSIRRAKDKNLEHNITLEDIEIPEYCPVLGIKLEISNGENYSSAPSLDRIDNSKGYVRGNVKVISHRANGIKKHATIEELELLIRYLKNDSREEKM